ncbi:MAG TPA: hypothetical protein VN493_19705 [Thermoanaerobaculia bacterium]|nr:hypothetical protein [Thermoanaerobaculia bacterium]
MENLEENQASAVSPPEAEELPAPRPEPRSRFLLLYVLPLLGLLLLAVAPLVRGTETLYLRDVLNTHFPMKHTQAEALRSGYFPLIDPYRAGGQPLAGNPNAVPFYPDNLLYLKGSTFWALNAHFWLHLLLAPLAFFWMAQAFGLRREAAWAAAACWTLSGFYLSHLSFYNLIAGVTLAPALVAACLRFVQGRRGMAPVIAVLWGLLLVGGDPLMALLAAVLAGAAVLGEVAPLSRWKGGDGRGAGGEGSGWGWLALLAAALAAGVLLALPQLVEFQRILPLSFRGHRGYSAEAATIASWDPRQAAEWLIPFVFGRPDLIGPGGFWGSRFFTGFPPYYLSLYPGLLALTLVAASGRPRGRAAWWAWGSILAGLFLSLGRFNPVAEWLFSLPGRGSLRYPVKFWLPVAVGAALLCGIGFQKLFLEEEERVRARRRFALAVLVLTLALGGLWAFLSFNPGPAEAWMSGFVPRNFVANERVRWAGLCLISLVVLAVLTILARIGRRRPVLGGALLLAFHAAVQLLLLRPLYPTDAVLPYRRPPPPALEHVPRGVPVVHADFNYLFGPSTLKQGDFPDPGAHWMERRAFYEIYPFTGSMRGRRYELSSSAEGLDTFLARMAEGAVKGSKGDDGKRLRLLAAWGVHRLLMNHPLDPPQPRARLVAEVPSFGQTLYIYEVVDHAPLAFLARRVIRAPHLNAAYQTLSEPGFNALTDAVVPGEGSTTPRSGGRVLRMKEAPERMELEVEAGPGGGFLVVQRSTHLWEAEIDGQPAEVVPANLYRIGLEVPPGRHRVVFRIDRTSLVRSSWGTVIGLALLPILALWGAGNRRRSEAPHPKM